MSVVSIAVTILLVLVGVMLRSWVNEMKELKQELKDGLLTKVDGTEFQVKSKWQEAEFGDMKVTIRELRASNDASHQAILFELKKTNDTLKGKNK